MPFRLLHGHDFIRNAARKLPIGLSYYGIGRCIVGRMIVFCYRATQLQLHPSSKPKKVTI